MVASIHNPRLMFILLGAAFVIAVVAVVLFVPPALGIDWRQTYRPASLAMLQGHNPYDVEVAPDAPFFAAPWGLLPLLPVALLPTELGRAIVMVGGLFVFAYTAKKLGATPVAMIAFLLSPPVMHSIVNANVEWLPLLGFVLPPPIGLFFIAVKPQTGFAVGIFWLVEAWRTGRMRKVVRTFAPITGAFLISFVLYGLWPLQLGTVLKYGSGFNSSLWPLSLPVGLALLVTSIQKRQMAYAMPASPCLSSYVLFHSWSSAMAALITLPLQLITAVVGLWIVVLMRLVVWWQ